MAGSSQELYLPMTLPGARPWADHRLGGRCEVTGTVQPLRG